MCAPLMIWPPLHRLINRSSWRLHLSVVGSDVLRFISGEVAEVRAFVLAFRSSCSSEFCCFTQCLLKLRYSSGMAR
jgi:hypothetical protein